MTNNLTGLSRTIDEILGEVDSAALRCSWCNGRARIEPESWPFDNRGKKDLRCLDCDFVGDLDVLKRLNKGLSSSSIRRYWKD